MSEFLLAILASLLAGFLTGFLFFYFSARTLRQEAEKLRNMVNILGRALESRGLAKFNWDEDGNMEGVVHFLTTTVNVLSKTSEAELDVKSGSNKDKHE